MAHRTGRSVGSHPRSHTGVAKTDPSEVKGFRVYWGYIGIMEKNMEATVLGCRVYSRGLGFRV